MSFIAALDRRAGLMHGMMTRMGVDVEKAAFVALGTQLSNAARTCAFCRHATECRAWLNRGNTEDEWPDFCPNAQRFERLRKL